MKIEVEVLDISVTSVHGADDWVYLTLNIPEGFDPHSKEIVCFRVPHGTSIEYVRDVFGVEIDDTPNN